MPWTATIINSSKNQGVASCHVALTDSVTGEVINRTIQNYTSLEDLKTQVRTFVDSITNMYAATALIPVNGQPLDYSATVSAPPTSTYGQYAVTGLAMVKAASKNYITIYNADPALVVRVTGIVLAQESTAAIVGLTRGYRLFRVNAAPVAGGSVATPEKQDSSFPSLDADITCRINGVTATAVGSALAVAGLAEDENTGATLWLLDPSRSNAIVLRQNQGIVVQQDSTAGTGVLSATAYFTVD